MTTAAAPLVIGVGNSFRRDDGAGPAVAERLAGRGGVDCLVLPGEGTRLMAAWEGRAFVIAVDAMRSGAEPGLVRRFDARDDDLPLESFASLSHRFGLGEAVAMAKLLGRLPERLILYGIEAADFGQGPGLTPAVARAVEQVVEQVVAETGAITL